MPSNGTGASPLRIVSPAHLFFAAMLVWLGILGASKGGFTAILSGVPRSLPGRPVVAYACAGIFLLGGLGVLFRRTAALGAGLLVGLWVLCFLLLRVPFLAQSPGSSGAWWVCGETAVMLSGAWVLYAWFGPPGFASGDRGLRIARTLYGLGLIPFGIAHFTFLERTVGMVPHWLPWHLAWAYFTGAAFIAAGLGIVTGVLAPLAAALSAWEMALFTLIVWVPIVFKGASAGDWNEFVDSVALTAVGWLVADTWRRGRNAR
jgi:uncharacterized membrane protein